MDNSDPIQGSVPSDVETPKIGTCWWDWKSAKNFVYDGEKWVEMNQTNQQEAKNTFGFRDIYSQGSHVYTWQVNLDGEQLVGSCGSERQAYRNARKAVKRYRKMEKFLNPNKVAK